ncbi:baseplate J-like protein [Desulfosporosinus acididurans]|uniref:Baseplate J-like protein n=1 Tax=Desulfosporosinus acididurans TaxID=476652 RepID=A0A0J1FTG2_9FIRM|nr:baseplate J/gp47 family protein [Desulfosporosinus acididurans]KLU66764.1 baseplate J-like protein [Desulfosporosinus acididurans]
MYETQTYESIMSRLLSNVPSDVNKSEGSIIWDALSPAALELAQQYAIFESMIEQAFISTASGKYLKLAAGDLGINPAPEEDDETLRKAALFLKQNPEKGGNYTDYERWALQVPGVQWAKAFDKARGLGTTDVYIAGDPNELTALVQEVTGAIDKKKVSGTDVIVRPVNLVTTRFVILIVGGITQEAAIDVANKYLTSIGKGGTADLDEIVSLLNAAGAIGAKVLLPSENVNLEEDSVLDPVVNII